MGREEARNMEMGGGGGGDVRSNDDTPIAPRVSTLPNPRGYFNVGSREENEIVLKVRISLKISAAE